MNNYIKRLIRLFGRKEEEPQKPKSDNANKPRSARITISEAAARHIGNAHPSTAHNYRTALRSLTNYCHGREPCLADITPQLISGYEHWLRQQGISLNTISCYMRSLRALYNKAAIRRIRNRHPFNEAYTGTPRTQKRSIGKADIGRLQRLELPEKSHDALVRDLFLFSFYAMGMPFIDMAMLKKSQVEGDTICYHRQKTGQQIVIHLEPCMQAIIDRHRAREGDYLFPILSDTHPEVAYRQYQSRLASYNSALKRIGKMAGINGRLTSYTSRHTWATIAHDNNIGLNIISQALGHTNTQTTLVYIADINNKRLAKANREILKSVSVQPLRKRQATGLLPMQKYANYF